MIQVQTTRASGEEVDLLVTGNTDSVMTVKLWTPGEGHVTARLMSVTFAIESDIRVYLGWDHGEEQRLILPLEGRGSLDFSKFGGLVNPRGEGWTGAIHLHALTKVRENRHFTLALELSKQRN